MSKKSFEKYVSFAPIKLDDRKWPSNVIAKAPIWCSVDLRDGNQALVVPMNLEEKLLYFKMLCDIGFKQIEVGFPSGSETEYQIMRTLIEQNLIPNDVFVQVLVQARKHLIEKTFESLKGAKNSILHFYNSTSTLQRKVVFKTDMKGVLNIAVEGAKIINEHSQKAIQNGMNLSIEYSPESFSATELDFSIEVCAKVMEILGATPFNKVILNLPATVEMSTPNIYADQIEYFCRNLPNRDSAIISIHAHNDRGTAVAASELAMLAGADRIEGTLFGNGERTGNADILNIALNLHSQGINPKLNIYNVNKIKEVYEKCTKMEVHQRHPYAGELVFTAFSGSHQDAISKGTKHMKDSKSSLWEIPYLPIDPADVGREYEPIIRINSQSGKGGAAYILQKYFGLILPKEMHIEFGKIVKNETDLKGTELSKDDIYNLFEKEYLKVISPYSLKSHHLFDETDQSGENIVHFEGVLSKNNKENKIAGMGNGPIDAFIKSLNSIGIQGIEISSYDEHAITKGSEAKAIAYIKLVNKNGKSTFGVGISANINTASIRAIINAINRLNGN